MPISNLDEHILQSGMLRRGKFLKKPRDTFTADVMKYEKSKPAPSQYQFMNLDPKTHREKSQNLKITGCYSQNTKREVFTDSAKWYASQVPFCKGTDFKKFHYVKPKLFSANLGKPLGKSTWQIQKVDGPAPGSYETSAAIAKTQWRSTIQASKSTDKKKCFVDIYSKSKTLVPGPGVYKNIDNHASILNKDKCYKKVAGLMI